MYFLPSQFFFLVFLDLTDFHCMDILQKSQKSCFSLKSPWGKEQAFNVVYAVFLICFKTNHLTNS